jgi:hypothetical protein
MTDEVDPFREPWVCMHGDTGNHRLPFDPVVEGLRPWWHRWGSPAAAAWPGVTA